METPFWNDEQPAPLSHLRVLDLSMMYPGPYLTRLLAQYGAHVIKVEHIPGGDPIRSLDGTALHAWVNQGKQSVAINLKSPEGVGTVLKLASEVDVFVENLREGAMDAMGLGYGSVSARNPDVLYLSLRGFVGKNAHKAGHDFNFVATSGCGEWLLAPGPVYQTHWADLIGGMLAPAAKLLAHLANPERRGMQLINYMDEGFRTVFLHRAMDALKARTLPESEQSGYGEQVHFDGSKPHSRYYRCADGGWISLNAIQDKHWARLCRALEKPEWRQRSNDPALTTEMEALFLTQPAKHWEDKALPEDGCLFRVLGAASFLDDPDARQKLQSDPLGWAGFAPAPHLRPAPTLGQDTFEVLRVIGFTPEECGSLLQKGIVFDPLATVKSQEDPGPALAEV